MASNTRNGGWTLMRINAGDEAGWQLVRCTRGCERWYRRMVRQTDTHVCEEANDGTDT